MIDLYRALFGDCPWCECRCDATWVERFLGADSYGGPRTWWQRVGWWFWDDVSYALGVWRLGRRWCDWAHR